ncbi:MAG: response regulator, partial [Elusimicrobiota bacterium]|nr:response regulator [Elusimicrobiota bacterium]
CDMILPDSDGIKIIKELNTIEPVKRIIYSSGYLDEQSRWKEIQKDKIPFVQKPFSMNKLMKVIAKSLKK